MRLRSSLGMVFAAGLIAVACGDPASERASDDDGSGANGATSNGVGGGGGELVPCDGGFLCGETCVDLAGDPLSCGSCGNACGAGEVCTEGACVYIDDCTETPCTGLSYCNLATKKCLPGCIDSAQCTGGQQCDVALHTCGCPTGTHLCSGTCSANDSPLSCGSSCTPCPTDPQGQATCASMTCGINCNAGFHTCGDSCVASNSIQSCGSSCTPCPTDPDGTTTCVGGSCVLTCSAGAWPCGDSCCSVHEETVTTSHNVGYWADIAVTPAGEPHVAFIAGSVFHGEPVGNSWSLTNVDGAYSALSIAVSPAGDPWIAYRQIVSASPPRESRVARRVGSTFTVDVLDHLGCCDVGSALTFDSNGVAYAAVSFYNNTNLPRINLHKNSGSGWTSFGQVYGQADYTFFGMDVDGAGKVHVGYVDDFEGVRVVDGSGTTWTPHAIGGEGQVALDLQGNYGALVHCSDDGLVLASRSGNSWLVETVTPAPVYRCDVAVDASGGAHLLYSPKSDYHLYYATKVNSTWLPRMISATAGTTAAIAADSSGVPHMIYTNGLNTLTYAHID